MQIVLISTFIPLRTSLASLAEHCTSATDLHRSFLEYVLLRIKVLENRDQRGRRLKKLAKTSEDQWINLAGRECSRHGFYARLEDVTELVHDTSLQLRPRLL